MKGSKLPIACDADNRLEVVLPDNVHPTSISRTVRLGTERLRRLYPIVILAIVLLLVIPAALEPFRLGLVGKYLCFAFCAVGLVLAWGYGGILSLGQGIFFGLGSYIMAMYMKLEATSADPAAAVFGAGGPPVPDFMTWNSVDTLPWWWAPFEHVWFALPAIVLLPSAAAFALAYAIFRKRIGGIYFSIVTMALASIFVLVIIGQQGYTGGTNGITNLPTFLGYSVQSDQAVYTLYYVSAGLLILTILAGTFVLKSRLGKVLIAIRDQEDRVRFSGYDPAMFKAVIFAIAAAFSAMGGALFTLQLGFASPSISGIAPSIEMVIYTAVGGRLSLIGSVYGALLIGGAKSLFSEQFTNGWMYFMGALFIVIPMFLRTGLAGLVSLVSHKKVRAS
ncbi:urea ABC transporter permease subunit UrtC [Pseudomonas typographi]|uniref:urea ABC transporter permease subunit UrtC n=1 Tax=Pseudomonas typographi TaxID=2715964 RepID=UPI001682D756|nr:urea ABC transporter permease subunit UrtC [Pseudomonas typographi]MBD1550555.1 urea ABC transporter permease subunit UrtC [Pseudomonas typographi]